MCTLAIDTFLANHPVFRKEELDVFAKPTAYGRRRPAEVKQLKSDVQRDTKEIRRGLLYANRTVLDETNFPFLLASRAFKEATLSYETALRFWLNQDPPETLLVLTLPNQKQWAYQAAGRTWAFRPVKPKASLTGSGFAQSTLSAVSCHGQEISITCLERTFIDVLDRLELASDPFEVWHLLSDMLGTAIGEINWDLLMDYMELVGSDVTCARVGHFLEFHQERIQVPSSTFRRVRNRLPKVFCRWHDRIPGKKIWDWNLYVPPQILDWETAALPVACDLETEDAKLGLPDNKMEDLLDAGLLLPPEGEDEPPEADLLVPVDLAGNVLERDDNADFDVDFTTKPVAVDPGTSLNNILAARFGLKAFRPGQEEIVRSVLCGRDALGILPTGSGKSLIYQILTMMRGGTTLVVSPLIALMEDQIAEATSEPLCLNAASINGTMDYEAREKIKESLKNGKLDLLFISPESLLNLHVFLRRNRERIRLITIDEAHCISAWGHDFRPAFHDLHRLRSILGEDVPILALTATATAVVRNDIIHYLGQRNPFLFVLPVSRNNLRIRCLPVEGGLDSKLAVLDDFLSSRSGQLGIVYCATRKGTERTARHLSAHGITANAYHAGIPTDERARIYQDFKGGKLRIVVATTAFGMGVNKTNIRFVAHLNLPPSIESYVQEIGRAGRDGNPADCLLIHSPADVWFHRWLASRMDPAHRGVPEGHILGMHALATQKSCRHKRIAIYFGDTTFKDCRIMCDTCCSKNEQGDVFRPAERNNSPKSDQDSRAASHRF